MNIELFTLLAIVLRIKMDYYEGLDEAAAEWIEEATPEAVMKFDIRRGIITNIGFTERQTPNNAEEMRQLLLKLPEPAIRGLFGDSETSKAPAPQETRGEEDEAWSTQHILQTLLDGNQNGVAAMSFLSFQSAMTLARLRSAVMLVSMVIILIR
jgi:hypothetical protein